VVIIIGTVVVFGLTATGFALFSGDDPKQGADKLTSQQKEDTDMDGLANWRERLWRTNPDNPDTDDDGTDDGAEVENNRSPTEAGPDDKLASSTLQVNQSQDQNVTKNLTSTALPRAAVLAYARQEEGQNISEGDIERIGSAMAENTDVAQVDLSTRVDISITEKDSPRFVETYFDKMDKAFSSVRHDDQPSPFAVIARAQQNGSLESAQIRPYIDQYQTAVEKLQSITVPKTFRDVHLKTLNSLERMLFALRRINSVSEDPVSAVIGVKELEKGLKANLEAVQMLNQKAKSYAESS
jgi:hypothetical protein